MECLPRGFQRVDERFVWKVLDDWFDSPFQAKGHVTRKRYRSTLDHYPRITLLESPIGVQAPEESVTGIRLQDPLAKASSVFDFCNSRRVRAPRPAAKVHWTIMHLMVSIEDHGDDLLFRSRK